MCQCIHAGGGGDRRRHAHVQQRIDDRVGRHLKIMADADLFLGRLVGGHGRGGHLAAGAGCGRHADQRNAAFYKSLFRPHIVGDRAAVGADQRHRLRRIHRAAAAISDHRFGAERAQCRRPPVYRLDAGVRFHVGKHLGGDRQCGELRH